MHFDVCPRGNACYGPNLKKMIYESMIETKEFLNCYESALTKNDTTSCRRSNDQRQIVILNLKGIRFMLPQPPYENHEEINDYLYCVEQLLDAFPPFSNEGLSFLLNCSSSRSATRFSLENGGKASSNCSTQ